ncbi:hypothetical protein KH5H1_41500 [Corallococcus caeni]|uniref:Uncharacterized protein n=1 Tax=Corallococcus exercitus TaxID=2316736 RepID=A0A3A8IFD4_9BACT|nr:hypothetical protein [Corallococcus exercitus]NOK39715.1 hypothetical protein [Corallococcus exercitus]RKG78594.1 hypothetical protein D7W79_12645 [Corallococcus exercitus]GMU00031.1 hypothetical protein KH5H1_41500 [Corallococcus sp. KH5-1]
MAEGINPKHLDKRTADRYQRSGQVDEDAYKKHLEELPDVADKAVPIETLMDGDIEDDFDDEDEDEDDTDDDASDEDDADEPADEEDKASE